jgi:dihydrofolate reductase
MVAHSLDDALGQLSSRDDIHDVFVVGGGEIYRQSIHHPNCRSLYITQINSSFDCDTHFPDPRDTFRLKEEGQQLEENGFLFSFTRWERVY